MGSGIISESIVCGSCRADGVIRIELVLAAGAEVDFFSCRLCDNRWWNRNGSELALDAVLGLASQPRVL